jgi:hypothetical protein
VLVGSPMCTVFLQVTIDQRCQKCTQTESEQFWPKPACT